MQDNLVVHQVEVVIKTLNDITNRSNYQKDVDPSSTTLVKVLGSYRLKEKVTCGLKTCHQPHNWGYLVLTEDGKETNIGNQCGRSHFGDSFILQKNLYEEKQKREAKLQALRSIQEKCPTYLQQLDLLRSMPYGADWQEKSLIAFRKVCPQNVLNDIYARARRKEYAVTGERYLSKEDIELLKAMGTYKPQKSVYVTDRIGWLRGLDIFTTSLKRLMEYDLKARLEELSKVDFGDIQGYQIDYWSLWVKDIEAKLKLCERLIADGQLFFKQSNIVLLRYLAKVDKDKTVLSSFTWDYDGGHPQNTSH